MKRYIVIEYDPKTCVDDVLDNAHIRAKATEYQEDPRK